MEGAPPLGSGTLGEDPSLGSAQSLSVLSWIVGQPLCSEQHCAGKSKGGGKPGVPHR